MSGMNWCEYPHTALLLGAAVLQLHPLQLKMGKGQHDTGPCSRWESKKTSRRFFLGRAGGSMWVGVGVVVGTREEVFHGNLGRREKKRPRILSSQQRGKVFHATPHPRPSPSLNSRPGFPTCRMLMPRERKGERDGTGLERDFGQRWEGMETGGDRIAWQPSRGTCTGDIIPGHLEHRPLTPTRAKKLLAGYVS